MAKKTSSKSKTSTAAVNRRELVGRNVPKPTGDIKAVLSRPSFVYAVIMMCATFLIISILTTWSRERTDEQIGAIGKQTETVRLSFKLEDFEATELKQEEARNSAPQVYELRTSYLQELSGALNGLPKAVAGKSDVTEIAEELRVEYQLSNELLAELQEYAINGETSTRWLRNVQTLIEEVLPNNPLIQSDTYQNNWAAREYAPNLKRLISLNNEYVEIKGDAIELTSEVTPKLRRDLEGLILDAGFPRDIAPILVNKLVHDKRPTLTFDIDDTQMLAENAAREVETQYENHERGDVIVQRGDLLTADQIALLAAERDAWRNQASFMQRWMPRLGIVGITFIIVAFLTGYITVFKTRIMRNSWRVFAIAALMTTMLAASIFASTKIYAVAVIAPTLFVSVAVLLAYDQRFAVMTGLLQAALTVLALDLQIGWFVLMMAGTGAMAAQLRTIRHRNDLIRASAVTAGILFVGAFILGLFETPIVPGAFGEITTHALGAGASSAGVGFLVLGILPSIEKLFGITTGMTLAELRDPSQALLRQLQERAPGTYNHSLQVANIAEAAANAINADSMLTYVGALYHDIGKMNKPEYFVENQSDGFNKHDKLSPAMSLLVITAHVKDGIELAREYGLPRPLIDFIETHHGTTLVEYFYHQAKNKAAKDTKSSEVNEFEYRYPGPKPSTRETAILMLSDAVESATRAMGDITPGRIESLVQKLVSKRLEDGQLDDSNLTFRELHLIKEAIVHRTCAIYHGRISYPDENADEQSTTAEEDAAATAAANDASGAADGNESVRA